MVVSNDKDDINDRNTSVHKVFILTILKQSSTQTPKGIQKLDPLEPYGTLYKDCVRVIMGLYRGSNFSILPGVWVVILVAVSAVED